MNWFKKKSGGDVREDHSFVTPARFLAPSSNLTRAGSLPTSAAMMMRAPVVNVVPNQNHELATAKNSFTPSSMSRLASNNSKHAGPAVVNAGSLDRKLMVLKEMFARIRPSGTQKLTAAPGVIFVAVRSFIWLLRGQMRIAEMLKQDFLEAKCFETKKTMSCQTWTSIISEFEYSGDCVPYDGIGLNIFVWIQNFVQTNIEMNRSQTDRFYSLFNLALIYLFRKEKGLLVLALLYSQHPEDNALLDQAQVRLRALAGDGSELYMRDCGEVADFCDFIRWSRRHSHKMKKKTIRQNMFDMFMYCVSDHTKQSELFGYLLIYHLLTRKATIEEDTNGQHPPVCDEEEKSEALIFFDGFTGLVESLFFDGYRDDQRRLPFGYNGLDQISTEVEWNLAIKRLKREIDFYFS